MVEVLREMFNMSSSSVHSGGGYAPAVAGCDSYAGCMEAEGFDAS